MKSEENSSLLRLKVIESYSLKEIGITWKEFLFYFIFSKDTYLVGKYIKMKKIIRKNSPAVLLRALEKKSPPFLCIECENNNYHPKRTSKIHAMKKHKKLLPATNNCTTGKAIRHGLEIKRNNS